MAKKTPTPKPQDEHKVQETSKVQKVELPIRKTSKENEFQNDHDYKVNINGRTLWKTKGVIETSIQRGDDVEIPKGSPFVVPGPLNEKSNCRGCGKR